MTLGNGKTALSQMHGKMMKHLAIAILLLTSTSVFGQNLLFDSLSDTTLNTEVTENKALVRKIEKKLDGLKVKKVYAAKWGDNSKREKYLVFTDSVGKVVVFQKGRRNAIKKMTFQHVFEGVGIYPWNSEMEKMLIIDFDKDGIMELLVIEHGAQRFWVLEMGSSVGDCCIYSVFKQYGNDIKMVEQGDFKTDHSECDFRKWDNRYIIDSWEPE